ncbi:hypothetical protein Chor_012547 [Crotalus horridus]
MAASVGPGTRTKTKKKHFVPQRVKVLRSADPLLGVLAWGINHQINELNQVPQPVMLLPDDFKASSKVKVNNHLFNRYLMLYIKRGFFRLNSNVTNPRNGELHHVLEEAVAEMVRPECQTRQSLEVVKWPVALQARENLPGHFKFKEYCPQVFRNLRERFNIDDQDYQVSLTRSPPTYETEGGGRFLLSYDRTVVIKEITSEDVADVHSLLSHYHQYIVKCHGSTLLPQFLSMYRLSVDNEESYMLVMRNMFSHRLTVHRKYDLKGSLISREASDKEKGKELPTLKDIDFLNMNQKVYISEEAKKDFMEKLKRDVEVL